MAKKSKTNSKMFKKGWSENDDAMLVDLLDYKIKDLKYDIKDASSPHQRARLKARRSEYKRMLKKVRIGEYNGNVLLSELASVAEYRATVDNKKSKREITSKYVSSYEDVDFDFDTYFQKKRYFGFGLPLVCILLLFVFIANFFIAPLLPSSAIDGIDEALTNVTDGIFGEGTNTKISTLGYFSIGLNENDFIVDNNGEWPRCVWGDPNFKLEQGEKFVNTYGITPAKVKLHEDLKIIAIDITVMDVLKAFFRLPLMEKNRIDFIEDMSMFKGNSWYYIKYMMNRADQIKIEKNAEGKYDPLVIVKHISTYGTIIFIVLTLFFALFSLLTFLIRMFTYTSKRLHFSTVMTLLCAVLSMLCLVFTDLTELSGSAIGAGFKAFFAFNVTEMTALGISTSVNYLTLISTLFVLLVALLPLFFRNKVKRQVSYVPKGNRPHIFPSEKKNTSNAGNYGGQVAYNTQSQYPYGNRQMPNKTQPKGNDRKKNR